MVDTLTAVNNEIQKTNGMTKQEIDKCSDARLLRHMSEKALYIKIADRLDNLYTIEAVKESKQFGKAQHTREILIPLVVREGAFQLVNLLEELCFKIEHKDRYNDIVEKYQEICQQNAVTTNRVMSMFQELFSRTSSLLPRELISYQDSIIDFHYNPRSVVSIFRQLSKSAQNLNKEFSSLLSKKGHRFI